jgi:dextranase
MKSLILSVWLILFGVFLLPEGVTVAQPTIRFEIIPDKTFYRAGETITLEVQADAGVQVRAIITHLTEDVTELNADLVDGRVLLTWTAPEPALRAYGVDAELLDADGSVLSSTSTAFDVLERWTQAPRYGFLSDFGDGRSNYAETAAWLRRHHINGLQFYDWQYRWENLVPDTALFEDGLGRSLSMETINRLIDEAHALNTAAMPYTAIYGASLPFYREHPEWALMDASGETYLFADFLAIMDPSPGSAWNTHLLNEFRDVLENTTFDGIHIDQYGAPRTGFNQAGEVVELNTVMPQFIDQTAELVDQLRGEQGAVIFNAVGNWPVDTVAPSQQDAVYIEVWPPHSDYTDLARIIARAQELGGGKPVIIAGYIDPRRTINWRLTDALIFASGAYHIETGEPETMLADPYFPRYGRIEDAAQAVFTRYYDFSVRYENVLAFNSAPASSERTSALSLGDVRTRGMRAINRVMPIVRTGENFETFSLINFVGIDESSWNEPASVAPAPFTDLTVEITVSQPVTRVWWASPDGDSSAAQLLDYTIEEGVLRVTLPSLAYWSMIVVEYGNGQ